MTENLKKTPAKAEANNNNNSQPKPQPLRDRQKMDEMTEAFKNIASKRENLQHLGGTSEASSEGTTHSVRQEEQVAFSSWINNKLKDDPDLKHVLPLSYNGDNLYSAIRDGILLCKIINLSCPDTIDERAINKKNLTIYTKHENLTLALNSAQAIGCNIINIDAHDLSKGTPHLVLGLLWQIIRIGIFNQINLDHCPGLVNLLDDDIDDVNNLMKLSPESLLLRWVNYHLKKAGVRRRLNNFTKDISDSEIYTHLLCQIAPPEADLSTEALFVRDLTQRAEMMLQQADKIGCRSFLSPQDVVGGVYKLNVAFLANLFNKFPALEVPIDQEPIRLEAIEETRSEMTWRNWMNSLGVSPYVNRLYGDMSDGLVLIQLYEKIRPGCVEPARVHKQFSRLKGFMERLENCNYCVELGRSFNFSLVGVAGQDIVECNKLLVSALVWQLMRAYTLTVLSQLTRSSSSSMNNGGGDSILSNGSISSSSSLSTSSSSYSTTKTKSATNKVDEAKIIDWANQKLNSANKSSSIRGFNDSAIATALPVIDLIDAIKPGSISYEQVLAAATSEEKLANSKYAISMARKIGAKVYALPEDIAEVKSKMVMTVFACLMIQDYSDETRNEKSSNGDSSALPAASASDQHQPIAAPRAAVNGAS